LVKFADLHLHTVFSDGTYTPNQLISDSLKSGLSAISVTDHDTVHGVEIIRNMAQGLDLEIIPGIELTAEYNGTEVHILGYFIDYQNSDLVEKLDSLKKIRVERAYKIIEKLKNMKIVLDAKKVFNLAQHGTVGRLHIARALVNDGLVGSLNEVFQKYIGDKCPAYVSGFRFSVAEAVRLIKRFGGVSVLAHPYSLGNDELIAGFVGDGVEGLEVYYSEHTNTMVRRYLKIAEDLRLLVTGGSDCHGVAKSEIKIGSIKIPYELVEKLKKAIL
jgi:predicted metal-dependent phosphoesterase TrpH